MASGSTEVWMYHRVVDDSPCAFGLPSCWRLRGTAVTPHELDRHLDGVTVLDMEEFADALVTGGPLPPGVVPTFDDGYAEHAEVVVEVLAAHGARATFFVTSPPVEPLDFDAWYWVADHAERPAGLLDGIAVRFHDLEGKRDLVAGRAREVLRRDGMAAVARLAEIAGVDPPATLAETLYLNPSGRTRLAERGHHLGHHGRTHRRLVEVADLAPELVWDGEPWLAYPDGAVDERVRKAVERAGFRLAFTCVSDRVSSSVDRLLVPRRFRNASLEG